MYKRLALIFMVIAILLLSACQFNNGNGNGKTQKPSDTKEEYLGTWSTKVGAMKEFYTYEINDEELGLEAIDFREFHDTFMDAFFDDIIYLMEFGEKLNITFVFPEERKDNFVELGIEAIYKDLERDLEKQGVSMEDFVVDYEEEYGETLEVTTNRVINEIWDGILDSVKTLTEEMTGTLNYTVEDNLIKIYEEGKDMVTAYLLFDGETIKARPEQDENLPDFFFDLVFEKVED